VPSGEASSSSQWVERTTSFGSCAERCDSASISSNCAKADDRHRQQLLDRIFSDAEPSGDDTALVESALADHQARLPPVVLTELLSDPKLPRPLAAMFCALPRLEAHEGQRDRAGRLRAKLIAQRRRARLAETLIAQSCIDHEVRLITRDDDFLHFSRLGRLRLEVLP